MILVPQIKEDWERGGEILFLLVGIVIVIICQDSKVLRLIDTKKVVFDQPARSYVTVPNTRDNRPSHTIFLTNKSNISNFIEINDAFDPFQFDGDEETSWIREYITWHNSQREQFPDVELLTNPNAPQIILCFQDETSHGGLHDRFQGLGHLLFFAFQARRLLLMKWYQRPYDLEEFLSPHLFNWTVPNHPTVTNSTLLRNTYPRFKHSNGDGRSLHERNNNSSKIWIVPGARTYGHFRKNYTLIWYSFFQPSSKLRSSLNEVFEELDLIPGHYNAIHCRVRHPAYQNLVRPSADDLDGFKFRGKKKIRAVKTALHAIQCSDWISGMKNMSPAHDDLDEPIYFYSDSNDLVREIIKLNDGRGRKNEVTSATSTYLPPINGEENMTEFSSTATTTTRRIVGRPTAPSVHVDQRGESLEIYMGSFIDLYVAANARCISLGVGNFAFLSSKISGTTCLTVHQVTTPRVSAKWGMTSNAIQQCPLPVTK